MYYGLWAVVNPNLLWEMDLDLELNCKKIRLVIAFLFQLRLYRNELSVEEVIRSRTEAIFHEKCRDHFTPKHSL